MESHASPDLLTVCQPRNGMRFLYGPNAATDGKSAGSGFAPRGGKDPTILGLILSRPFVTATDVEIGSRRERQIEPRVFGDVASRAHFRVLDPKTEGSILRADASPTAGDTVARPRPATFGGGKKPNATLGSCSA